MPDHATRPEQQGFDFGLPFGMSAGARAGEPPGRLRKARRRPGASSAVQQDLDAALFGHRPPYPRGVPFAASGLAAPEAMSPAQTRYYRWWVGELEAGRPVMPAGDYASVLLTEILREAGHAGTEDALRRVGSIPASLLPDPLRDALPSIRAALAYRAPEAGGLYGWRDAVIREHAITSLPPRLRSAALCLSLRHPDRLAPLLVDLFADEIAASHAGLQRPQQVRPGLQIAVERWSQCTGQPFTAWLGLADLGAPMLEREKVSLLPIGGAGAEGWAVSIPPGPDVLAAGDRLRSLTRTVADHVGVVLRTQAGEALDLAEPPALDDELLDAITAELGGYGEGRGCPYPPRLPAAWRRAGGFWPSRPAPQHLLGDPTHRVPLTGAYFRGRMVRLAALEPGDPALDAYLTYRQRFLQGEYVAVEAEGEGPRCRDEMLMLHIEALHTGWETEDPQAAAARLAAIPTQPAPEGHSSPVVSARRVEALADIRAVTGGVVAWARTWGEERLAGHVSLGHAGHPLVGTAFGIVAQTEPVLAGRLLADFGIRIRHHPLPPDHEHFERYRERLSQAFAVCLRQWPIWYRQSFIAAMGGHPGRKATLGLGTADPQTHRRALEVRVPAHHALDAHQLEGGAHIDRGVAGAVARQVAILVRAQAGERQPRTRRPPLPEGVGDYIAEALGGYGAGGSPFRDLQRAPETQFADFAHGAEVTLADIDFDAVARAHADADHMAHLLEVIGVDGSAAVDDSGGNICTSDRQQAAPESMSVADPLAAAALQVQLRAVPHTAPSNGSGQDTGATSYPDHDPASNGASPFNAQERALLLAIARGPISAADLRPLAPGVMIDAALERINDAALAHFGDLAVVEEGATLALNEALHDRVIGGMA
jgi:hypothetical protein